jgi:hypothetical protein
VTVFSDYTQVTSGLFVHWFIPNYSEGSSVIPTVFRFSDYNRYVEFLNDPLPAGVGGASGYYPLQRLLTISPSKNQVQTAGDNLNITINAYEQGDYRDMDFLRNSRIEGSEIVVKRALFDRSGELLPLTAGNPVGRFKGFVETYTINDTYDITTGKSDTVITLNVTNYKTYLDNKQGGRKTARPFRGAWITGYTSTGQLTSPVFLVDNCFNNVAKLSNTSFEWGKKS